MVTMIPDTGANIKHTCNNERFSHNKEVAAHGPSHAYAVINSTFAHAHRSCTRRSNSFTESYVIIPVHYCLLPELSGRIQHRDPGQIETLQLNAHLAFLQLALLQIPPLASS